jgi:hypothetical protein
LEITGASLLRLCGLFQLVALLVGLVRLDPSGFEQFYFLLAGMIMHGIRMIEMPGPQFLANHLEKCISLTRAHNSCGRRESTTFTSSSLT